MPVRITILVSFILVILYSLLHAWWVDEHPPMRNDDHFNTEIILSQHHNPDLYPNDLAWSNSDFASNHGFLFVGILRLAEDIFGSYREAWSAFTFLFLLVYIPGFYLFIYEVTSFNPTLNPHRGAAVPTVASFADPSAVNGEGLHTPSSLAGRGLGVGYVFDPKRHWLSLTLAIASTMPIYLYVTFANWGVTSVYAHVFVTALSGWLFWGLLRLLQNNVGARHASPLHKVSDLKWLLFGILVSLTVYLNPVNGGGLIGILSVVLLAEVLAGRLRWLAWIGFLIGAVAGMLPYVVGYVQALQPTATPSQADYDAAQAFMANFYGTRLYPWVINENLAPFLLAAVALTAVASLFLFSRWEPPRWWTLTLIGVQLLLSYLLIGHPVFLLVFGYWWFRTAENKVDRWDKLFLAMIVAVNLIAPLTSAVSKYLWLEADINLFFTVMFETIRLERWVMLPVYVFIARWIVELIQDDPRQKGWLNWIAAACILATLYSIFGSSNPVKDDAVFMKTYLPVRWILPAGAIALVWLRKQAYREFIAWFAWADLIILGAGFVLGMSPLEDVSTQGSIIRIVLTLGVVFLIFTARQQNQLAVFGLAVFFTATVIVPIAGYHKDKPDINWCDAPFIDRCVDGEEVIAAGEWLQMETSLDASIFVVGLQPERFQPMAQRSTVHINFSQIYWFQGANALLDALEIDAQLQGTNPLRGDYRGDDYLLTTLKKVGADYIVIFGSEPRRFDLPIVYESESTIIYELDNT